MSTSPIRKQKRAQVALEFVLLVMVSFIMFTTIMISVSRQLTELSSQRDAKELRDVTNRLREEIFLASIMQEGYYREFRIPGELNGKGYSLVISDGILTGRLQNYTHRVPTPNVLGNPNTGLNVINKTTGGDIRLN